jgi:hypothetical protein
VKKSDNFNVNFIKPNNQQQSLLQQNKNKNNSKMSCAVPVNISDSIVSAFGEFKRGNKTEHNWLAYRLTGNDLNTLELADSGTCAEHDEFVERALVGSEPRFCFVNFEYDLGVDGKRKKCILVLWVPPKAGVRAKMLSAAARSPIKKALGFGYGIEVQATDKAEAAAEVLLEKCLSISR